MTQIDNTEINSDMDGNLIHIALVGGQPMPVYVGLKETEAGKVLLIHSSSTKSQAEKIREDIISEKNGRPVELVEIEPYDYVKIRKRIESLLDSLTDCAVEANVSGGTKPWSIVFGMLAGTYGNMRLLYVDQNGVIYNYATSESHSLTGRLGIAEIFRFNQTAVHSFTALDAYTEADLDVLREVKTIRNKYHKMFNTLTIPDKKDKSRFANNVKDTVEDSESCSEISWDRKYAPGGSGDAQQYVRLYFVDKCGRHEEFKLVSPHAFDLVTASGWFEYEVAVNLRKCLGSRCREVWMNVKFPYDNKNPKNEIDIILLIDNKLLFVECKTQVFDRTDIDKFASAVKNYGGLGSKAIFITQQDMGDQAREKCVTNNIACFSLRDRNNRERSREELSRILGATMENGNTR